MPEESAPSVPLLFPKAKPEDAEDPLDSDGTSNLRRSKRRNKFHLDMAAMLSGNNPDRRLSLSPPPKGSSLLKLPSTSTSSLSVKHTNATRKHSPTVSDSASSEIIIPPKVAKSKFPRVVRAPPAKVEQKGDNNSNLLGIDVADKKEAGKGSAALAKSVSPKHASQFKKGTGEGRGAHWKKKAASTETDVSKPVISASAERSKLNLVEKVVLMENPKPELNSEPGTSEPSEPDVKKPTFSELIKEPDAVCSNEVVIERKTSSSTSAEPNISGKRKRKVPLRHSDFTLQDRDSDQDESLDDFSCTKCPAQFESRVGLTNHMKLHGAQKQFPCEHCDFCCTNKKTMRQHRRIHGIHKKQGGRTSPLKGVKGGLANPFSLTMSPPPNLTTTSNVVKSPTTLAEMQPKMRAIDMALKLNLDEDGNPKPVPSVERVPMTELLVTPLKVSEGGAVEIEGGFDEAMPVLFREEHLSVKKPDQSHSMICRKESDNASDAPVSSRKSVKCPECPFRTRSQARLQPHLVGHSRKSGFLCPLCNFKSESAGFLKRHCDLHKADYKWPPDYVGIPQEQLDTLLAKERDRIEQESVAAAAAALLSNGVNETSSCKVKPRRLFSASSVSPMQKTNSGVLKDYIEDKFLQCPVGECGFRSQFKMEVVCHELKSHKDKFKQKKFPKGWPSPLTCKKCGTRVLGRGNLHLHTLLRHPLVKKSRKLFEEMMAERLQNPAEDICVNQNDEDAEIKVNELLIDSAPEEEPIVVLIEPKLEVQPSLDESVENGEDKSLKQFVCSFCPFACSQLIRLKRHENKHLVKADHQCPNCSFSCRSTEILGQHLRLHNTAKASTEASVGSKAETATESKEDGGSTSGRRNELLKCADCPYKSKHGCDMKAHIKMHQEKRTYACSQCSYSSMRFNALKSHELLHVDMQSIKTEHQDRDNSSTPKLQSSAGEKKIKVIRCARSKRILGSKFERGCKEDTFYRCRYCMSEMRFCSDLWAHSRECPFHCDTYGKLWHHYQKHKKVSRFACNKCTFSAGSIQCLGEHMILHVEHTQISPKLPDSQANEHSAYSPTKQFPSINGEEECAIEFVEAPAPQTSEKSQSLERDKPEVKPETFAKNAPVLRKSATALGLNTEKCCNLAIEVPPTHLDLMDRIRSLSATEGQDGDACSSSSISSVLRCKECPFECSDTILEKLHADMHKKARRPFQCNMCSFNCFSAESLHSHLSLHAPPLSPVSATHMRKRLATRRRNGVFQPNVEALPLNATNVLQCSQCNFKTVQHDRFMEHRMEHVQLLQQRLITTIKRSANEEMLNKIKIKRVPKKADKLHSCSKCCFRCDTVIAYSRHMELHEDSGTLKCSLCDYSSSTHNIVLFHEQNHHLERSLTGMCNSLDMVKRSENRQEDMGNQDQPLFPGSLNCTKCNFVCYELRDLGTHWDEQHVGEGASDKDKEISQMLKIGLVPRNAVGVV